MAILHPLLPRLGVVIPAAVAGAGLLLGAGHWDKVTSLTTDSKDLRLENRLVHEGSASTMKFCLRLRELRKE